MGDSSNQAKEIFLAALENHTPEQWPTFLHQACGDDAALRAEVEKLLNARAALGSFHEAPQSVQSATADEPMREQPGTIIGSYKLLEEIGEGGFGIVFMAEQQQPLRRMVALKVLKPGMDTRQVVARFEAERQALALMDHPNIARVFDGGETVSGRPYFVMELVRGVPISEFCDRNHLPIRERLELFLDVCQAVQHAHQKGVIHRDLKPSNVLVTLHDDKAVVKVIDFGIAKAIGQQLTDKTLFTGFAQMIGTPLYMSPEQAQMSSLDVDTRSDIYSLGVLLYELLTGTTPFDRERLRTVGYDEMRRIIREEEPPRPSTRISTLGQAAATVSSERRSDPKRLSQLLRGELDWIVMKALEKDRNRRYETASALAADVRRYLQEEPVLAFPPSVGYRLHKFARRYKGALTAAVVMLTLLLAGTAVSIWQAVRATRAERQTGAALVQTSAAQAQTREALDALTDDVVETMFARQTELGEKEKAFLTKVVGFYEAFTQQSAETIEARFLRAKAYFNVAHLRALLGGHPEAAAGYRQAEALLEQLADEFPNAAEYRRKLALTCDNLGVELAELGKEAEAEEVFRRGIALRSRLADEFPQDRSYRGELAGNYHDLGCLHEQRNHFAEAAADYQRALELQERLVAETGAGARSHQALAGTQASRGRLLRKQGKFTQAEKCYVQAVKAQEEQLRKFPDQPKLRNALAESYHGLAIVFTELGREAEAETAFHRAVDARKKLVGDFPRVIAYRRSLANDYISLGVLRWRQKKPAEAEEPYRQALELRKMIAADAAAVPHDRTELASSYYKLGHVLRATGRPREAEAAWRDALALWTQLVADAPQVPEYRHELSAALGNLARLHLQRREFAAALLLLAQARSHLETSLKAKPQDRGFRHSYRNCLVALAQGYLGLADHAKLAATANDLARVGVDPAKDAFDAACMMASCITLADKDARRRELAPGYAERALTLLGQAVARGYKDAAHIKENPDLQPLRTRPAFQNLLADLEGKSKE